MMWNLKIVGEGMFKFQVFGKLFEVLAEYDIIDYATNDGTIYLVRRANDHTKQMWTEDFIQAQDLCKEDYKARFL